MRYIIIPVLIILYIYWSYRAIRVIFKKERFDDILHFFWIVIHGIIISGFLIFAIIKFW